MRELNKTRKIKKKGNIQNVTFNNNKSDIKGVEKIKIDDVVGCVTVNNSFEENFKNYFKNKKSKKWFNPFLYFNFYMDYFIIFISFPFLRKSKYK